MSARLSYSVSGPGLDKAYEDAGPALSRAITAASASQVPCTYYVRDVRGDAIGYAERDEHTHIRIVRQ